MKFFSVVLLSVFLFSCQGINKVLKSKDAHYKLRVAEQYYAKGKYNYAQQLYEDVMPFFKSGAEFEDIYYKYAYTAYHQRDYLNAENLFKTYLEIFPNIIRNAQSEAHVVIYNKSVPKRVIFGTLFYYKSLCQYSAFLRQTKKSLPAPLRLMIC